MGVTGKKIGKMERKFNEMVDNYIGTDAMNLS